VKTPSTSASLSFTPHDLRRTAASHVTKLGVPLLHVEKVLNHSTRDIAEAHDRRDYLPEKRAALERWGITSPRSSRCASSQRCRWPGSAETCWSRDGLNAAASVHHAQERAPGARTTPF